MADVPIQDECEQRLAAFRPRLGEMTQLPLRALVAYAARSARRVQPFFTLPEDHPENQEHAAAVERAIQIGEEFARGSPVTWDAAFRAGNGTLKATGVAKAFAFDAACAAWAAHNASKAVESAASRAVQNAAMDAGDGLESVFPKDLYGPIDWPQGTCPPRSLSRLPRLVRGGRLGLRQSEGRRGRRGSG